MCAVTSRRHRLFLALPWFVVVASVPQLMSGQRGPVNPQDCALLPLSEYPNGPNANSIRWYLAQAEKGDSFAQYRVGLYYDTGWFSQEDKVWVRDYEEAAKWLARAVGRGNPTALGALQRVILREEQTKRSGIRNKWWDALSPKERAILAGTSLTIMGQET
jgi:hypothetical protein